MLSLPWDMRETIQLFGCQMLHLGRVESEILIEPDNIVQLRDRNLLIRSVVRRSLVLWRVILQAAHSVSQQRKNCFRAPRSEGGAERTATSSSSSIGVRCLLAHNRHSCAAMLGVQDRTLGSFIKPKRNDGAVALVYFHTKTKWISARL
ncbi:hypothetical protein BDFG_05512 [Blastomyces dermatitidis ATCC 26199]|nr:hypothetical protein BDFG_05512 [Blastomyces dermatitidis ATCC 26199]